MKKSTFWLKFLFGLLFLFLAIFLVVLTVSEKADVDSDDLVLFYAFAALSFFIGVALLISAGGCMARGFRRDYLLDRMEYRKDIESRGKGNDYVRLLLSEADKENSFHPAISFHSIHGGQLLDKNGDMLTKLPDTFLVRQAEKEGKTAYHILPTRTNEA
jgi:hypothetical protein